ncbi:MAG: hypothetical protein IJR86_01180 [Bacteroidaceae bacterium]|nr:hypothetical protein [Bacteroidaceae bacterium]
MIILLLLCAHQYIRLGATPQMDYMAERLKLSDANVRMEKANGLPSFFVEGGTQKIATDSTCVPAVSDEAIVDEAGKSYVFSVSRQGRQWLFTPVEVRRGEEEDGMMSITPVDASSNLSCIAQTGAYYILSEMKKGETGEE